MFFMFVAFAGLGWVDTSASNLQAVNFALDKGLAVGITRSVSGLSGAILSIVVFTTGLTSSTSSSSSEGQINSVRTAVCDSEHFVGSNNTLVAAGSDSGRVADGGLTILLMLSLQALILGGTAGNAVRVIDGFNIAALGKGGRMKMQLYYVGMYSRLIACLI